MRGTKRKGDDDDDDDSEGGEHRPGKRRSRKERQKSVGEKSPRRADVLFGMDGEDCERANDREEDDRVS